MPPTLARFAPMYPSVILMTSFGATPELLFYDIPARVVMRRVPIFDWAASLAVSPDNYLIAIGLKPSLEELNYNRRAAGR